MKDLLTMILLAFVNALSDNHDCWAYGWPTFALTTITIKLYCYLEFPYDNGNM